VSEWSKIARLRTILHHSGVPVGIGDDAAVMPSLGNTITVDAQVEHVHFERAWLSLTDLGYRSIMTAASDLAAMRARPLGLVSALTLPASFSDEELAELAEGQRQAATMIGAPVVGGNLARGQDLSITVTAVGDTSRPLLRSGAEVGHWVQVLGDLGLAAAGLSALRVGERVGAHVDAWRRPRARFDAVLTEASAGIDVSDGLLQDLAHIAHASGVGVALETVPLCTELVSVANRLGRDPLELALHGGEDYTLLVCAPTLLPGFIRIGTCVAAKGITLNGKPLDTTRGFDHF
jgi:thiamine-monophosphate kinase